MLNLGHHLLDPRFPLSDTVFNFSLVSLPFMRRHHRLLPLILCPFVHFFVSPLNSDKNRHPLQD